MKMIAILFGFIAALNMFNEPKEYKSVIHKVGPYYTISQTQKIVVPARFVFNQPIVNKEKSGFIYLLIDKNMYTYKRAKSSNSYYRVGYEGESIELPVNQNSILSINLSDATINSQLVDIEGLI